jgi:hypothetical protein
MELDDLKQQWQSLDRKLERTLALNLQILTETRTRRMKQRLLPVLLLQPLQLAIGFALTIFSARFWIANMDTTALLVSGLALHAFGIGLIADGVMRIQLITRIRFDAPVVTIQRHLAYLKHWEVRSFKWGWMIVWALVPAMLIVAVKAVANVDLWSRFPPAVAWTAAGSAVGMAASYAFDRWAHGRWPDLYVGHSVAGAQAALDEIDRFARE